MPKVEAATEEDMVEIRLLSPEERGERRMTDGTRNRLRGVKGFTMTTGESSDPTEEDPHRQQRSMTSGYKVYKLSWEDRDFKKVPRRMLDSLIRAGHGEFVVEKGKPLPPIPAPTR